ncbi:MAG: hypothetical protein WC175_01025 [Candidatus Dojkabacteria bacterium]
MEWNEIFMDSLPYLISILSILVVSVLSYFKIVNWDASIVEGVIKKIVDAIFETELKNSGPYSVSSDEKLAMATEIAKKTMNKNELRIMKQIGKKTKEDKGNPFLDAVQSVFVGSAKNLLEFGVKKGINKIIGK